MSADAPASAGRVGAPARRNSSGSGVRWADPFRRQRARYGRRAGFRWWQRLGAGVGLLALIAALGVLLAALVGFGGFLGGIALEALIG